MSKPKHDLQRIRIDRDGYDDTGAYWGGGPDVFISTSPDGNDEVTVRAKAIKEAREKINAELARAPAAKPVNDEPIGGNPRRTTRYEIAWLNPLTDETIRIRITHARDYLSSGSDHIEVESIAPKKAPLPITETGYRSHFMTPLDLMNAGGPVTFVTAWIEHEAKGKAWNKATSARQQGDLFSWAEAQGEVAKKAPKPRRADSMLSRQWRTPKAKRRTDPA